MTVTPGSSLMFSTDSDDHGAVVVGPGGVEEKAEQGKALPTDIKGFYTLSVIDRQMRELGVELTGTHAVPSQVSDRKKIRVQLSYRVA